MDSVIQGYFDKEFESYDNYTKTSYGILKERRAWQKLYSDVPPAPTSFTIFT
ncbi:MAG: hypothetical protein WC067_05625 [Candidatus Methanomethylophilaceae archaeon]